MLAPELRRHCMTIHGELAGNPSPRTLSFCVSDVENSTVVEVLHSPRAALHPYLGTGHKQGQLDPSPAAFREAGGGRRAAGSQQPYDLVDAPVTWTTAVPMSGHWALGTGQRGWVKQGWASPSTAESVCRRG
ncbi:hypothetical protein E4U47_003248 [Claviceps purpurea]|nr:hypothetical protein E4U10_007929 [Claviceps purpurea]KAG6271008.1 hypothetical protein E4U47_003248 [Claviceps purpurea]